MLSRPVVLAAQEALEAWLEKAVMKNPVGYILAMVLLAAVRESRGNREHRGSRAFCDLNDYCNQLLIIKNGGLLAPIFVFSVIEMRNLRQFHFVNLWCGIGIGFGIVQTQESRNTCNQ